MLNQPFATYISMVPIFYYEGQILWLTIKIFQIQIKEVLVFNYSLLNCTINNSINNDTFYDSIVYASYLIEWQIIPVIYFVKKILNSECCEYFIFQTSFDNGLYYEILTEAGYSWMIHYTPYCIRLICYTVKWLNMYCLLSWKQRQKSTPAFSSCHLISFVWNKNKFHRGVLMNNQTVAKMYPILY